MSKLGGGGVWTRQRRDPKKGRALARALKSGLSAHKARGSSTAERQARTPPGRRYLGTLEGTAQRKDCFRMIEARISSDTCESAQVDKRQRNKVRDEIIWASKSSKVAGHLVARPWLLEVAVEGERGSGRRRKGPGPGQADR